MKKILILLLFNVSHVFLLGQTSVATIDSIAADFHQRNPASALTIGFIQNGKEDYFNYGNINRDDSFKANEKTIYPIGSLTKIFTANLILQAQIEGKLNVDDFIDAYLPTGFVLSKDVQKTIKISDLASHQSGLPDFNFEQLMKDDQKQPLNVTAETIHSLLNEKTILTDYGVYRYSNFGYVVLGMILKTVYGKDFDHLVQEKILDPSKMKSTLTNDFNIKNKITGYDSKGVAQELWKWNDWSASAGLMKSNTSDMVKFIQNIAFSKNKISGAAELSEALYYKNTYREVGFGPQIKRKGDDVYYFKTGNTFSGASILAYDKKAKWGIVMMMNLPNLDLMNELMDAIYEKALKTAP